MNFADYFLLALVAAGLFFALRSIGRHRGGCNGCNGCCTSCSKGCRAKR